MSPNCTVYVETGMLPLKIDIQSRIVAFWSELVQLETHNLSSKLYCIAITSFENRNNTLFYKWFVNIRSIFIKCGTSGIWDSHTYLSKTWLTTTIKQQLTHLYIQEWRNECDTNTSCNMYKIIKPTFGFETYFT